jgi:hypothetical protein
VYPTRVASTAWMTACNPDPQTRLTVDRLAGNLVWHPGLDRRLTRDVHAGPPLQHTAHDHVSEIDRLDGGAADRLANDDSAEVGCGEILQGAAKRSDRRAARAQDHGGFVVGHIRRL